jgi:hypothetical protein
MEKFELIKNTYPPIEAREVLLSLIGDKIRFLNIKSWRIQEMHGADTTHITQRIEELKETNRQIQSLLEKASADHMDVEIESNIFIRLKEKK